ncbi:MAG: peptide chain release factor N(5)-glutamine methyltransferase [Cytophagales bacterium]|nr:peptide chain release factor N(5)-glutamine methyltransferase [Cytophagales bacterium]
MTSQKLLKATEEKLKEAWPEEEARALAYWVVEELFGLDKMQCLLNVSVAVPDEQVKEWQNALERLLNREPVQYVFSCAYFYGRKFRVTPSVLIPRPETEELVRWILDENADKKGLKVLDIGTGSGCIPISLSLERPDMRVSAVDISSQALKIARDNAQTLRASVEFFERDILARSFPGSSYDIVVSNPPYVRVAEKEEMDEHVLEHEPHLALFVEDDTPLLFYRRIAALARKDLVSGGKLYFEINEAFAQETVQLMEELGFEELEVRTDMQGKDRMVRGKKK